MGQPRNLPADVDTLMCPLPEAIETTSNDNLPNASVTTEIGAVLFILGYCSAKFNVCDGIVLLLVGANGIYVSVLSVTCLKEYKKNNLTTIKKICKCCYKKDKKSFLSEHSNSI